MTLRELRALAREQGARVRCRKAPGGLRVLTVRLRGDEREYYCHYRPGALREQEAVQRAARLLERGGR